VRIVGATNLDLPSLAAEGKFRADLLDRLAFDVVTIPPLRERREDIALLAAHFARAMSRELGRAAFAGFTASAAAALQAYAWPGNVRELRNVVERAVCRAAQADRPIDAIAFDAFASPFRPPSAPAPAAPPAATDAPADFPSRIRHYEESLLREALAACRFNQRRTAEQLSLSYDQLRHYLKKHGIAARRM